MKIKVTRHGKEMYIREFGPKIAPPPPVLPPGFTHKDYIDDPPRRYYEVVYEPKEGTDFTGDEAMKRAKMLAIVHHGELVEP